MSKATKATSPARAEWLAEKAAVKPDPQPRIILSDKEMRLQKWREAYLDS